MNLAHFQVARCNEEWVVQFEDRDYRQSSREVGISVATKLATRIARLGVETVVFIEPMLGEDWIEWRPNLAAPERLAVRRSWSGRSRSGEPVPYLRLISSG